MKRLLPFLIIGVVLVVAVLAAVVLLKPDRAQNPTQNSSAFYSYTPPPGAQPPHAIGPENASVVLEEYGDYQCPPCAAVFPQVKKLEAEFGDRMRFIFRQNPLPQIHRNAVAAAHAAEAAGMQGHFWGMHDKLYENQKAWGESPDPRPYFIEMARTIGLDVDRFVKEMSSKTADDRLIEDIRRGQAMGVAGTPTFYLNGRELKGPLTFDEFRKAINAALNSAGK
jgi:protein-disulfide isomerase